VGNKAKADAREIATQEKRRSALELRKSGLTYEEIGIGLACSTANAHKLVRVAIDGIPRDLAREVLELELARLDAMQSAHWANATAETKPSVKAAGIVLRIMERRAAMLGIDAPKRTEIWGSGEPFDVTGALG
jgi:hypothetical protein